MDQNKKLEFIPNPISTFTQTIKNPFEIKEVEEEFKDSEIQHRNNLSNQLNVENTPKFFKSEINLFLFKLSFFLIIILSCIGVIGFFVYAFLQHRLNHNEFSWFNPGYFVLISIIFIFSFIMIIVYWIKVHFLRKEIKTIVNGFDRTHVSVAIQRMYKSLIISFSNINWFSFYIYLMGAFSLLIIFIISFSLQLDAFINNPTLAKPVFGGLEILQPNDKLHLMPKISLIVICTIMSFTLIAQIFMLIFNMIRIRRVESSYCVPILSSEEIVTLKHAANKRNLIIFIVLSIVLTLAFFIVYFIFKKIIK